MPTMIKSDKMLRHNTPIEDYTKEYGIYVKREDLSCPLPGPPFSKTRGVYAHLQKIKQKTVGVLDTFHSQAGWAVARACQILGKKCFNFYPHYKADTGIRESQAKSKSLGAELIPLPAGRSCILYHAAKKQTEAVGGFMIANALKLKESIEETQKEVPDQDFDWVLIPASSGTIAAGVIKGFGERAQYIVHLGYSRSRESVLRYLQEASGVECPIQLIDEGYAYKDEANPGENPPWPCNAYYDLKAFRWFLANRSAYKGKVLFWNIG